ncbi:MAG: FAD-dependent oxidoreductase [Phycisphaerales bacterium]
MDFDAIIVGAGIGAGVLAHRLARGGKRVVLLDRAASPPTLARPEILWPQTVRALASLLQGRVPVDDVILPLGGVDVTCGSRTFAVLDRPTLDRVGFGPASTDPEQTRAALLRDAPFDVRRGIEVLDLLKDDACIRGVRCRDRATSGEFDLAAPVVVGDDGSHSRIRELAQIHLSLRPFPLVFVCFGFDWPASLPPARGRIFLNLSTPRSGIAGLLCLPFPGGKAAGVIPARPESLELAARPDDAWRRFVTMNPIIAKIAGDRAFPDGFTVVRREWGHADHYGSSPTGGVYLLGDALHPVSPAGGQGANMSVADAGALADALLADSPDPLAQFERRRRSANERAVDITRRASGFLSLPRWCVPLWSRPILARAAAAVVSRAPGLIRRIATSFVERDRPVRVSSPP